MLLPVATHGGCARTISSPDINYDTAAPATLTADPPSPVKIVELPNPCRYQGS
ncbi:hypothetical protein ABID59_004471 [Bradyrhizobium sp. S3.3.6]